jgi:flagellar motor component MotA
MESEKARRKAIDTKREVVQRIGVAIGTVYLMIAVFLLVLSPNGAVQVLFPITVFFLVLGTTLFITSYKEEWFYPKRKNHSVSSGSK